MTFLFPGDMMVKKFSALKGSDEKGLAPVIGTAVTIVIVFILAGLVSSVFFEEYGNPSNKISPTAKLQIYFTGDESSLSSNMKAEISFFRQSFDIGYYGH